MNEKILTGWSLSLLLPVILSLLTCSGRKNTQAETLFVQHPDDSSKKVEYFLEKPAGSSPWPTVIFLRSVLYFAKNIKAAALILNGEQDDRTDPNQARHLAEEIIHYGGNARAIIYPKYGHQIPVEVRNREIDPFIESILRK